MVKHSLFLVTKQLLFWISKSWIWCEMGSSINISIYGRRGAFICKVWVWNMESRSWERYNSRERVIAHCKIATLSRREKPMLSSRRYRSTGRQRLQFYNELTYQVVILNQYCPNLNLDENVVSFQKCINQCKYALISDNIRLGPTYRSALILPWIKNYKTGFNENVITLTSTKMW